MDWRYRARDDGDYSEAAKLIHRSGGIVVPAHPYCAFVACRWKFGHDEADAVEVWNGPWTTDDESAVDTWDSMLVESVRGERRWLPAIGNSDAHSEAQVIDLPHDVVLSDGLSKDALLDGIRAGRNWIAGSSAVDLTFSATSAGRTAGISERLAVADPAPVDVTLEVSGVPNGVVRMISDEGQVVQASLPASGRRHGHLPDDALPGRLHPRRGAPPAPGRNAGQRQRHRPRPADRADGRADEPDLPGAGLVSLRGGGRAAGTHRRPQRARTRPAAARRR
ncbi:MAG TPA: CehA/McbA family metallohydrolase [Jatrophihabitantaceae bacterium]